MQCTDPAGAELYCGNNVKIPVLAVWIAICAFARDGLRHGYSASVAALTPVILLMGPLNPTTNAAFMRVAMTFLGVILYLIIDTMIWPSRVSILVRSKLLETIDEIVTGFQLSVDTVHTLLKYCDRRYVDPEHTVTVNHTNGTAKPGLSVIAETSEVHPLKNTTEQTPPSDLEDSVIIEIKSLSLAAPSEKGHNSDPSDDPNASLVGTPQQTYIIEDLAKCDENFKLSLKSLGAVTKLIKTMSAALVIVDSEPDFLNRYVLYYIYDSYTARPS